MKIIKLLFRLMFLIGGILNVTMTMKISGHPQNSHMVASLQYDLTRRKRHTTKVYSNHAPS